MPTQKGFLFSFFSAFRAHSQPLPKQPPSRPPAVGGVAGSTQTIWTSTATTTKPTSSSENISSPRPINPKAPHHAYATASTAPFSTSPTATPTLQHNVSPSTHLPRSSPSPGLPVYGPPNKPSPSYPTAGDSRRNRRGSDSSSDSGGFREVRTGGGEKWFVGGRTAAGEEKYYKLSMIKRERSADRISADRLSL